MSEGMGWNTSSHSFSCGTNITITFFQSSAPPRLPLLLTLPSLQARLPNGLRVFLLEDHEVPLIRGTLITGGGRLTSPVNKVWGGEVMGGAPSRPIECVDLRSREGLRSYIQSLAILACRLTPWRPPLASPGWPGQHCRDGPTVWWQRPASLPRPGCTYRGFGRRWGERGG